MPVFASLPSREKDPKPAARRPLSPRRWSGTGAARCAAIHRVPRHQRRVFTHEPAVPGDRGTHGRIVRCITPGDVAAPAKTGDPGTLAVAAGGRYDDGAGEQPRRIGMDRGLCLDRQHRRDLLTTTVARKPRRGPRGSHAADRKPECRRAGAYQSMSGSSSGAARLAYSSASKASAGTGREYR